MSSHHHHQEPLCHVCFPSSETRVANNSHFWPIYVKGENGQPGKFITVHEADFDKGMKMCKNVCGLTLDEFFDLPEAEYEIIRRHEKDAVKYEGCWDPKESQILHLFWKMNARIKTLEKQVELLQKGK